MIGRGLIRAAVDSPREPYAGQRRGAARSRGASRISTSSDAVVQAAARCSQSGWWGWFKHRWIAVKWLVCASGIAVGYVALGSWLSGLVRISADHGLAALEDPAYRKLLWFIAYQASTWVAALVLTVFRPWRKRTAPAGQ